MNHEIASLERRAPVIPEREKRSHVVMKFGGFCMATADNIRQSADIVLRDSRRVTVVVSAPGSRPGVEKDLKITDHLLTLDPRKSTFTENFVMIDSRYMEIATELFGNQNEDIDQVKSWINDIKSGIIQKRTSAKNDDEVWLAKEWAGSRGEWLMRNIFAHYLRKQLPDQTIAVVDPADYIKIQVSENKKVRTILPQTYRNIATITHFSPTDITVASGYYGSDENGNIVTLGRGGSDATATAWAVGSDAESVEMFKDVPGVLAADPRLIPNARKIEHMQLDEITEMAFRGADVLQARATAPMLKTEEEIPIYIKGLSQPDDQGTLITRTRDIGGNELAVGIAQKGNKDGDEFVSITLTKAGIDSAPQVVEHILAVFGKHEASVDHLPTSNNSVTVLVQRKQLNGGLGTVTKELEDSLQPDELVVRKNLGIVGVIGDGIRRRPTTSLALVFSALDKEDIEVVAVVYGSGSNNIVFAVDKDRVQDAVKTVYDATIHQAA